MFAGGSRLEQSEQIVAQLHEGFRSRIYFLALRELRSPAAADDVCQETLIRVLEAVRAGRLDSPETLPGYVAGTARNVIREFRRKEDRFGPLGTMDPPAPDAGQSADPAVGRAIEMVLRRLKPRERDFLRLYYYEDLTKEEISQRLGVLPERVRLVKTRALKSFREFYLRLSKK